MNILIFFNENKITEKCLVDTFKMRLISNCKIAINLVKIDN